MLVIDWVNFLCFCDEGTKYCALLESECGLSLLEPIAQVSNNTKFPLVRDLARQVLRRCEQFRLSADAAQSTEDISGELDAPAAAAANNVDMTDDENDEEVMDYYDSNDDDSSVD